MRLLALTALATLGSIPALPAPSFHLNPPQLPPATVGKAYAGGPLLISGGGQCPRNFASVRLVAGALPPGLHLAPTGDFAGAPLEAGRYEFVVRVENGCGWSDQPLVLEVTGAPILLANPAALQFRVMPGQGVAPAVIQVSASVPGSAYTVSSSAPWIRAQARTGRIPAAASAFSADLVEVEIDSATLPPGSHRGSVEIGAWRAGQGVAVPVEVEVLTPAGTPASVSRWLPAGPEATPTLVLPQPHAAAPQAHQDAHAADPHAAPAAAAHKKPAASPKRMSRSAQLRSKYLAAKPAPAAHAAAHPPKPAAAAPAAPDPHAKPSPVGEHKAAAPAKPAADAGHGAPPAAKKDAHGATPAAKKDDHAAKPAEKAKDGHGAAKDEHKSKPKEEHKDKSKH